VTNDRKKLGWNRAVRNGHGAKVQLVYWKNSIVSVYSSEETAETSTVGTFRKKGNFASVGDTFVEVITYYSKYRYVLIL
jgi:hypothetical protein